MSLEENPECIDYGVTASAERHPVGPKFLRITDIQDGNLSGRVCRGVLVPIEQVVERGEQRREQTPWARTVRTCQRLLRLADGLWTFLEIEGIEPTNNAAERALRQSVIQRKISHGVQSARGALCRSRLLTVTTILRQQGRVVWIFLEQAWIAHHHGGMMPSLLPELPLELQKP